MDDGEDNGGWLEFIDKPQKNALYLEEAKSKWKHRRRN